MKATNSFKSVKKMIEVVQEERVVTLEMSVAEAALLKALVYGYVGGSVVKVRKIFDAMNCELSNASVPDVKFLPGEIRANATHAFLELNVSVQDWNERVEKA